MLLVALLWAAPALAATPCHETAKIAKPDSGARFQRLRAWLAAHPKAVDEGFVRATLPQVGGAYVVDADNDGAEEYVAFDHEGSGGYLNLWVFKPSGKGFSYLPDVPPKPEGASEVWSGHEAEDPLSERRALFTEVCGKTYMSFLGDGRFSRAAYIWKRGKTQPACDADWLRYARSVYAALYRAKGYGRGDSFLRSVASECESLADPIQRAWVYSDLAVGQHKLGERERCLADLAGARSDPKAVAADGALAKALEANEALCKGLGDGPPPRDFRWLLDAKLANTNQVVWDQRFDGLLRSVVPDLPGRPDELRRWVERDLTGPPDGKGVEAGRYVTLSACQAHSCGDKALLWADAKGSAALFAVNDAGTLLEGACAFAVGSRTVAAGAVPEAFWREFRRWRTEASLDLPPENGRPGCVTFIDPAGRLSEAAPLP